LDYRGKRGAHVQMIYRDHIITRPVVGARQKSGGGGGAKRENEPTTGKGESAILSSLKDWASSHIGDCGVSTMGWGRVSRLDDVSAFENFYFWNVPSTGITIRNDQKNFTSKL